MKEASLVAFGLYVFALIGGCLLIWAIVISLLVQKRRVAPVPTPRPLAPWGLIDIAVGFMFIFLSAVLFGRLWIAFDLPTRPLPVSTATAKLDVSTDTADEKSPDAQAQSPDEELKKGETVTNSVPSASDEPTYTMPFQTWLMSSQLFAMIATTIWVSIRCRVGFNRVGFGMRKLPKQIFLGIVFAAAFAPPIYVVMAVLTNLLDQEYKHPLIEMIGKDPTMLLFAVWSAVIVAPITEEFAFRVMIQGFLESMAAGSIGMADLLLGRQSFWPILSLSHTISVPPVDNDGMLEDPQTNFAEPPIIAEQTTDSTQVDSNLYAMQLRLNERSLPDETPVNVGALPWWPVFVSGALFGLVHYPYGISWIPLIFLGIVLGWLYRITGTIWPSLVVHMIVNATSMAALATQLASQAK